nr:MBL fold metallo-hydrolase [Ardenticatena sp.]
MYKVADRVYYHPSFKNINLGLVETDDGVVLVDTPMLPSQAIAWREEAQTYGPIQFVLLTDHLVEHIMGALFMPGSLITHHSTMDKIRMTPKAKEHLRKRIIKYDPPAADLLPENFNLPKPHLMLYDRFTIYLGGRELEFIHLPGHSPNNAGLYVSDVRVLFTGNVVTNGHRPYLGLCDISTWITTLQAIRVMEVDIIVPGQGAPMTPDEVEPLIQYLEVTRERIQSLVDEGRTRDEVVSKMMAYFDEWPTDPEWRDEERNLYRQGIRRIYDRLAGRSK